MFAGEKQKGIKHISKNCVAKKHSLFLRNNMAKRESFAPFLYTTFATSSNSYEQFFDCLQNYHILTIWSIHEVFH